MLPKQNRIQSNKEFQWTFKHSKPVYAGNLAISVSKSKNEGEIRFGFVISNKIDKRATRRNALKRQLRAIAGGLISELKQGYDIVTVVKRDFTFPYDQEEIKKQFVEGIRKSGIINNEANINKDN